MNQVTKTQIKDALKKYVQRYDSQNAAANSLTGVSPATISLVLNNNWEQIADPMWRKISRQIGFNINPVKVALTSVYRKACSFFGDAQRNPNGIHAIICNSGLGKDIAKHGWCNDPERGANSYFIDCHRQMSVRIMFRDMLKAMGKDSSGTVPVMMENLVKHLERENEPLFIINEADKLRDEVLEIFIDIENKLHGKCGLVMMATPYLKARIEKGVANGKRGFAELYSRMHKIFWDITPDRTEYKNDVKLICNAYGITDGAIISEFHNKCDNDNRVLENLITAFKNQ